MSFKMPVTADTIVLFSSSVVYAHRLSSLVSFLLVLFMKNSFSLLMLRLKLEIFILPLRAWFSLL